MISQVVSNFWGSVQKIVRTMASDALVSIPKRHLYSPELKSQVVAQTQVPGATVAGVALAHGIDANIVHR